MSIIFFLGPRTIQEIDEACNKAIKNMLLWYDLPNNSKRRVCKLWVRGEPFNVRKNYIEKDIKKIYKRIKLDIFKI